MSPTRSRSGSGSQFDGATAPQKTSETPFRDRRGNVQPRGVEARDRLGPVEVLVAPKQVAVQAEHLGNELGQPRSRRRLSNTRSTGDCEERRTCHGRGTYPQH
jgi:hypothetical protein